MSLLHRFIAYEPMGAFRANLPYVSDWSYSSPFDDRAALNFSYQDGLPGYEALLTPCEVGVEVSNDGGLTWKEIRNGRFLRIARGYESGSAKVRKYTLPHFVFNLDKAHFNRSDEVDADGKYTYKNATAGGIIKDSIDMCQPTWCPSLTYSFTGLVDSAGAAWTPALTIPYEPGTSIWTILNDLVERGAIDWYFQGRELRVFNANTAMAVAQPVIVQRSDLEKLSIEGSLEDYAHSVVIFGDKDTEDSTYLDTTYPQYWGRWEVSLSSNGDDVNAAQANARALLADVAHEQVQYAATLDLDRSTYTPFYSFNPGDFVQMEDENGDLQSFRCRGVNFTRNGQGQLQCTLIINDRFVERTLAAQRRANGVVVGTPVKGGTANSGQKPQTGTLTPAKGVLTSVTAVAYINGSGYSRARVEIVFQAITTGVLQIKKNKTKNATGQVMRRYEFRGCVNDGTNRWESWGTAQDAVSSKFVNGLTPATSYLVQYAGVSADGIQGAWSDAFTITTPQDVEPPPKPSTPVVTTRLGQLIVDWDGKSTAGTFMGKDFDRVEIRMVGVTDAVGVFRNGRAPYVVPNVTIGTAYTVFLRPYDRQGNVGTDSDNAAAVTVKGVMDDTQSALQINQAITIKTNDKNETTYSNAAPGSGVNGGAAGDLWYVMSSGQVTAQYIWSGSAWVAQTLTNSVIASLDAGKITTGTLAAARIAANTITADMINAGAIDATKLTATAIDGKTISAPVINGGQITGTSFQTAPAGSANRTVIGFDGRFYAFGYNQATSATEMMWDFKPYAAAESTSTKWGYCKFYMPVWASAGLIAYRVSNKDSDGDPMFGQELGLLGYTTDYGGSSIYLTADSNDPHGRVYSISIYARTYTSSANMYITSSYTLGRSTSATKYKDNIDDLNEEMVLVDSNGEVVTDKHDEKIVQYRDILDLAPKVWYDHGTVEHYARSLSEGASDNADIPRLEPIPGLLAEDVLAALGPEFVEFAADGETVEGIMYDRIWILLLPIVKNLKARIEELESK